MDGWIRDDRPDDEDRPVAIRLPEACRDADTMTRAAKREAAARNIRDMNQGRTRSGRTR